MADLVAAGETLHRLYLQNQRNHRNRHRYSASQVAWDALRAAFNDNVQAQRLIDWAFTYGPGAAQAYNFVSSNWRDYVTNFKNYLVKYKKQADLQRTAWKQQFITGKGPVEAKRDRLAQQATFGADVTTADLSSTHGGQLQLPESTRKRPLHVSDITTAKPQGDYTWGNPGWRPVSAGTSHRYNQQNETMMAKRKRITPPGTHKSFTYSTVGGRRGCSKGEVEKKYFDFTTETHTNTDGTWQLLGTSADATNYTIASIPQGTTPSSRIGRKICIEKINFKVVASMDSIENEGIDVTATYAKNHDEIRMALVLDKSWTGSTTEAALDELWNSDDIFTYRNLDNNTRFEVLWDKTLVMQRTGFVEQESGEGLRISFMQAQHPVVSASVKKEIELYYNNTTGASTELTCANLYFVSASRNGLAKALAYGRIRYFD